MTGEKNRYKPLAACNESRTPEHDEMVLYLLKPNALSSILSHWFCIADAKKYYNSIKRPFPGLMHIPNNELDELYSQSKHPWISALESEVPIFARNGYLIGYWDLVATTSWGNLYFEVKPKVNSFGEVLRQIKTYQAYCPESQRRTVLFTKDTNFYEQFIQQGIVPLLYPSTETFKLNSEVYIDFVNIDA